MYHGMSLSIHNMLSTFRSPPRVEVKEARVERLVHIYMVASMYDNSCSYKYLGMGVLGEERQDGVGDLLRVLRVGVVARVLDHLVPAQSSW
jgi:hypothetical protein